MFKPCPFCGSANLESGGDDKIVAVRCRDCEATGPNHYGSRAEWNTRSLHRTEPQTAPDNAPTRDELWTAIRDRDARINALYVAMKEACDLLTERKQGGHARSPNHNARLALEAAMKDRPTAAPADAERLALADGDIVDRLKHAIATATNDDETKPLTDKRARQVERIDTMLAAIDEIERLRAGRN